MELYEALVIDNSEFYRTGRIKVRLNFGDGRFLMKDMSINPQKSIEQTNRIMHQPEGEEPASGDIGYSTSDVYVELTTPMGGAYDYGLFTLPQPNTYGIVANIFSVGRERYIWMGNIIPTSPICNNIAGRVSMTEINAPSDNEDRQNALSSAVTNISNEANSTIIFKHKERHISKKDDGTFDSEGSRESLDWKKAKLNNMGLINSKESTYTHNIFNDKGEKVGSSLLSLNNEGINISQNNTQEKLQTEINISNGGSAEITVNNDDYSRINTIKTDDSGISISYKNGDNEGTVTIGDVVNPATGNSEGKMIFSFKPKEMSSNSITITFDKNGLDISSPGDITISPGSGKSVSIGSGTGMYLVATNTPGTISNFESAAFTGLEYVRV